MSNWKTTSIIGVIFTSILLGVRGLLILMLDHFATKRGRAKDEHG
jgi:hypothetical protein